MYILVKKLHKFAGYVTKLWVQLVPSSSNRFITFINIENFPASGVKHQVEHTHKCLSIFRIFHITKRSWHPKYLMVHVYHLLKIWIYRSSMNLPYFLVGIIYTWCIPDLRNYWAGPFLTRMLMCPVWPLAFCVRRTYFFNTGYRVPIFLVPICHSRCGDVKNGNSLFSVTTSNILT